MILPCSCPNGTRRLEISQRQSSAQPLWRDDTKWILDTTRDAITAVESALSREQ